jgi:hypothetical protein
MSPNFALTHFPLRCDDPPAKSGTTIMRRNQNKLRQATPHDFAINDFASPIHPLGTHSSLGISINFNVTGNLR